jgi:hypothetical protein
MFNDATGRINPVGETDDPDGEDEREVTAEEDAAAARLWQALQNLFASRATALKQRRDSAA